EGAVVVAAPMAATGQSTTTGNLASLAQAERAQVEAAARRIEARADARQTNVAALDAGGIAAANPPERVARRLDRLTRYCVGDRLPETTDEVQVADPDAVLATFGRRRFTRDARPIHDAVAEADGDAGKVLERIIETSELL